MLPVPMGQITRSAGTTLARVHLIFLLLAAGYVVVRHPMALGPTRLVLITAVIAEASPLRWRHWFAAELLLLATGILTFLWSMDIDQQLEAAGTPEHMRSFWGWVRIVFVAWILVPSRPGYLRWVAVLVGVELLLLSRHTVGQVLLPAAALVPYALAALAADAQLRGLCARPVAAQLARSGRVRSWRWLLVPVSMSSVLALATGTLALALIRHGAADEELLRQLARRGAPELDRQVQLGDTSWIDKDPRPLARLEADGLDTGVHYLRALALSRVTLDGGELSWTASGRAVADWDRPPHLHRGHEARMGRLSREIGNVGVVLRPDGCAKVELLDLHADADGNLFRDGLGEIRTSYEVDLGAGIVPWPEWARGNSARFRHLPPELQTRLQTELRYRLRQWAALDAPAAAAGISDYLQQRCDYSINDRPEPGTAPGSAMLTFLFAEQRELRRGHCQYFASAAVLLLRAAGHAARCAVGFASDEVEEGAVTFRALNAHAWAEVLVEVDGGPGWMRVDATPHEHLAQRREGVDLGDDEAFPDAVPDANDQYRQRNDAAGRMRWYVLLGLLVLGALGLVVWRARRAEVGDPRVRVLQQRADDLIELALQFGIPVDPHNTLSQIAGKLEAASGRDLDAELRAHLSARFADGPMPPPWPLAELRAALRERAPAAQRTAESSAG